MTEWRERWTENLLMNYHERSRRYAYASDYTVRRTIAVLEDWFQAIEAGTAQMQKPSPLKPRYTKEQYDALVDVIDERIEFDIICHHGYWADTGKFTGGVPIDTPADFNRLEGEAREAFAQDVFEAAQEEEPSRE